MATMTEVPEEALLDPANLPETLRRVSRQAEAFCKKFLKRHHLTMSRYEMLLAAHQHPGANLHTLAQCMGCSPGNVTTLSSGLEQEGWIVRKRAEGPRPESTEAEAEDRRAITVHLTEKGQQIESIAAAMREHVQKRLVASLPAVDLTVTLVTLAALHKRLQPA